VFKTAADPSFVAHVLKSGANDSVFVSQRSEAVGLVRLSGLPIHSDSWPRIGWDIRDPGTALARLVADGEASDIAELLVVGAAIIGAIGTIAGVPVMVTAVMRIGVSRGQDRP